ncbi:hypothetical protein Dsin_023510 [Dipteronia sinensis]|uniref:Phosphoglycerate mutase-like protein n=1 Tax=Dipteronia sinensis TaxID=43782 RepID=A0AAE0E0R7_9ROSI|nr:hypothetical protein Dsin_023510 [Dipteronia sinensis]
MSSRRGRLILLFIRHGETQDNIDRILQGHRDTSLTKNGIHEAELLAVQLKDQTFDVIYHSPLIRILQTIEPLQRRRSIHLIPDDQLKGQCLGELEGVSYDSINMSSPRSADNRPGVELFDDFVRRLKGVFGRIVGAEAPKVGEFDRVVGVATHGVAITSLFKALENKPDCDGFNPKLATRGPDAYEVRWTDSDDVARLSMDPNLPISNGVLDWESISGEPFLIEYWGKKEKANTE